MDKRDAFKETPDNKVDDDLKKRLIDIQQLLLNMQPKDYLDRNDDLAKMTKAKYLDRKIKNVHNNTQTRNSNFIYSFIQKNFQIILN